MHFWGQLEWSKNDFNKKFRKSYLSNQMIFKNITKNYQEIKYSPVIKQKINELTKVKITV